MTKVLLVVLAALILPALALGATPAVASLYAGVNGVWFQDTADVPAPFKADIEAVGHGKISLSPHLSGVGTVAYGFSNTYFRYSAGGRVTVTDTENKNFSMGLGIEYRGASIPGLKPDEWCPGAAVGVRPWPDHWPKLIVGGEGWYGLETGRAGMALAARWQFDL
jgi:hypothetical protein